MKALLLIAGREFRTYTATASFWAALLLGPLLIGAAALAFGGAPQTTPVAVIAENPHLQSRVSQAVLEAARLEGRSLSLASAAAATATVEQRSTCMVSVRFSPDFPLSPVGRALAARTISLGLAPNTAPTIRVEAAAPTAPVADRGGAARFAIMMMLWLTLTGSLGMLLQAVVRERSNRSLELLLAAVRPWQLVAGKVAGVGLVSLLVLSTWLGATAVAAFTGEREQLAPLLAVAGEPVALARAVAIYVLGFAFYGLATVAIGAAARDSAAAQNLARPMFVILLVAFFVAMSAAGGSGPAPWLTYLPPLTPFLMLMQAPSGVEDAVRLLLLALSTGGMGYLAVRRIDVAPAPSLFGRMLERVNVGRRPRSQA